VNYSWFDYFRQRAQLLFEFIKQVDTAAEMNLGYKALRISIYSDQIQQFMEIQYRNKSTNTFIHYLLEFPSLLTWPGGTVLILFL